MRAALLFALGAATAATADPEAKAAFDAFLKEFEKSYETAEEYARRLAIYVENRVRVAELNIEHKSATFALNEFADMTWEEFRSAYIGGFKPAVEEQWAGLTHLGTHEYSGVELPETVDWTEKGAVTPTKNQQQCGSCWAFSTTGALEGRWEIASGKLVSLSEQQLVDCSHNGVNQGCHGGLMNAGFVYVEQNGLCTEDSYPYVAKDQKCKAARHTASCTVGMPKGSVKGFKDVKKDDEEALMEAVSKGPVSIAIEADHQAFQFYSGGVLKKACGTQLDHGVLLVGYGEKEGAKFWKVKNSWGGSWGDHGYIELERGKSPDGKDGECGLLRQPSFPVVEQPSEAEILV
jgi:C1A family cysteine protease